MLKVFTTMPHIMFGVWGIIMAVWALVELLNVSEKNIKRLRIVSVLSSVFIWISYIVGGWWYWVYYPADKKIALGGAFPEAHKFFMEAKEHIFFILLLASMVLPIIAYSDKIIGNKHVQKLAISVAIIAIVLGFGMEGMGSLITKGVKIGLLGQ
ncbi:MAG: hypothetical protein ACH0QD_06840 [Tepidibacillus sp.]